MNEPLDEHELPPRPTPPWKLILDTAGYLILSLFSAYGLISLLNDFTHL